jgi:hypothetical protein
MKVHQHFPPHFPSTQFCNLQTIKMPLQKTIVDIAARRFCFHSMKIVETEFFVELNLPENTQKIVIKKLLT